MKRTTLIILLLLFIAPAALRAQQDESIYRPLGIGFQVGVGGMLPTGSLADDFKGCALFTGGVNVDYNRLRLNMDFTFGQPSFKNVNPYAVYDDQARNVQMNGTASTSLLGGTFQLGYTVLRHGRLSVTPAVGVTFSRLSWDINHIKYERDDEGVERPLIENVTDAHENNTGWTASIGFDIKLHGKIVDFPMGGDDSQGHYTSSVRITPFVTNARFNHFSPSVKGCCVGVTVSYAGLFRMLR